MARPKALASLAPSLGAALFLAGCGGLSAGPRAPMPDLDATVAELAQTFSPRAIADCLATPLPSQAPCRDTIGYSLMAAIDLRYAEFEARFFDDARYGNFGTTLVTLGLTGAASVSPVAGANILAAIATGVGGGREAFSRDVLVERTSTALLTAMRSERQRVLLRLRDGLRQPPATYPFGWALSDLYGYYRAGTVPGALTAVTRDVGERAQQNQDAITDQSFSGRARAPARAAALRNMPAAATPAAAVTPPPLSPAAVTPPTIPVAPASLRPPPAIMSSADAAAALASFLEAGPSPASKAERIGLIIRAGEAERFPDFLNRSVTIQAFALDPAEVERRAIIARRLNLAR